MLKVVVCSHCLSLQLVKDWPTVRRGANWGRSDWNDSGMILIRLRLGSLWKYSPRQWWSVRFFRRILEVKHGTFVGN